MSLASMSIFTGPENMSRNTIRKINNDSGQFMSEPLGKGGTLVSEPY